MMSRIIGFEDTESLCKFCIFLSSQSNRFEQIHISDFIQDSFLPSPYKIFCELKKRLNQYSLEQQKQKIFYVTGINGLLKLWKADLCYKTYECIRNLLDNPKYHVWFFVNQFDSDVHRVFKHPRYRESNQMITIDDDSKETQTVTQEESICLVNKKYLSKFHGITYNNFRDALKEFGTGTVAHTSSERHIYIGVAYTGSSLAGIKESIEKAYTLRDFFKLRYNLSEEDLSDSALQWLYDNFEKSKEYPSDVYGFLRDKYFPKGIKESQDKLPKLLIEATDTEKELLFWALCKNYDPDCYLSAVLQNPNVDPSNFAKHFICQPLDFLSSQKLAYLPVQPTSYQVEKYAEQRQKGIASFGVARLSSYISQFIQQASVYSLEEIAPWLNNDAKEEKCEIIRRIGEIEQASVPSSVLKVYPLLEMYLQDYNFPIPELNSYFTQYRTFKIKNRISEDFCQRASQISYPPYSGLKDRNEMLQKYSADENTGLIVVDGLSAEYLPMLIALAQNYHLGLEEADICIAKTPTTTSFNNINWDPHRRIDVKSHDNTIHDGEEKHISCPFENNFVAMLDRLYNSIITQTDQALMRFDRVILTSDHGSTRLAVIAYDKKLAKTLQVQTVAGHSINDWRYTSKESLAPPMPGCVTNIDGVWTNVEGWHIVKGYNRFPKSGAKYNECHGGLTLEEVLVPFLIFRKGAQFEVATPAQLQTTATKAEFVEDTDFDL